MAVAAAARETPCKPIGLRSAALQSSSDGIPPPTARSTHPLDYQSSTAAAALPSCQGRHVCTAAGGAANRTRLVATTPEGASHAMASRRLMARLDAWNHAQPCLVMTGWELVPSHLYKNPNLVGRTGWELVPSQLA